MCVDVGMAMSRTLESQPHEGMAKPPTLEWGSKQDRTSSCERMLTVCAENYYHNSPAPGSWLRVCPPAETVPTEFSKTCCLDGAVCHELCLPLYLCAITLSPCPAVRNNPASCSTLYKKLTELVSAVFYSLDTNPSNLSFPSMSLSFISSQSQPWLSPLEVILDAFFGFCFVDIFQFV